MTNKVWDIPLSVMVETDTENKARLIVQNALAVHDEVRSYNLQKGTEKLLHHWKPIASAPKDCKILGCEASIGLIYSASSPDERSDIRDYSHISPDFAALIRATLAETCG